MFTQKNTHYNSLYFSGGSWIEVAKMDSMKLSTTSNDFTLQFWVAGSGDIFSNDGPALFSLIDTEDSVKLALYRDSGAPSLITMEANSSIIDISREDLNWNAIDEFYLISILFSEANGIKGYLNDSLIFVDSDELINVSDTKLMIGVKANKSRTILEKFWYGYFDEIRLWNTLLADSTIQFQYEHPDKFGAYYRYTDTETGLKINTYLDSLIGLWRFNLSAPTAAMIDESGQGNHGTIYTLSNFSVTLSDKGAQ